MVREEKFHKEVRQIGRPAVYNNVCAKNARQWCDFFFWVGGIHIRASLKFKTITKNILYYNTKFPSLELDMFRRFVRDLQGIYINFGIKRSL